MKIKLFLLTVGIFFLLASLNPVFARTNKMVMGYFFSLGNSTCIPMECNLNWVAFYLPLGLERPQYIKFLIFPECFNNPPNGTEQYSINMYCLNGYNETIDMKPYMCNNANPIVRWIPTNTTPVSYYFHKDIQYEAFWCAFKRPYNNLERLPTEIKVIVDTMGLITQEEETALALQKQAGSNIISGIGEVFSINLTFFQIIFYLLVMVTIGIVFIILVGGIPMLFKWIAKKVTS